LKAIDRSIHMLEHIKIRVLEDIGRILVNPFATSARAIRNATDNCGCE